MGFLGSWPGEERGGEGRGGERRRGEGRGGEGRGGEGRGLIQSILLTKCIRSGSVQDRPTDKSPSKGSVHNGAPIIRSANRNRPITALLSCIGSDRSTDIATPINHARAVCILYTGRFLVSAH